jgi:hypothetical protein
VMNIVGKDIISPGRSAVWQRTKSRRLAAWVTRPPFLHRRDLHRPDPPEPAFHHLYPERGALDGANRAGGGADQRDELGRLARNNRRVILNSIRRKASKISSNREGRLSTVGADIMQHVADARTPLETMRPRLRYRKSFI